MEREVFEEYLQEITFTLHRNFKEREIDFLFKKLSKFDDDIFKKVLSWYLREDHPQMNIAGYFLNRGEPLQEAENARKQKDREVMGSIADLPFTYDQEVLLRECHNLAYTLAREGHLDVSFDTITAEIDKKWDTLPEINLTSYLQRKLNELKKIREAKSVISI
jgi:hypothetical protein